MNEQTEWLFDARGVRIEADHLLWFEQLGAVASASGAAMIQSFAEFMADGPPVPDVPGEVIEELLAALR